MATIDATSLCETFTQSVESYLLWDKLKAEPHQAGDNEGIIIGPLGDTDETYEARKHIAGLWIVRNARSVAETLQTHGLDPVPILAIANQVRDPDNGPAAIRAAWPNAKAILQAATIPPLPSGTTPATGNGKSPADDSEDMVSTEIIAKRYGLDGRQKDCLRHKLKAWRAPDNSTEWTEVQDRKPRQPAFLYRLGSIRHLIDVAKSSG
jgi:hypothetical protein